MDYICNGIIVEKRDYRNYDRLEQYKRILAYYYAIKEEVCNKDAMNSSNSPLRKNFMERESDLERKLYEKLKKWESRHPIIGIIICTILLGILISLLAGIILEAIY